MHSVFYGQIIWMKMKRKAVITGKREMKERKVKEGNMSLVPKGDEVQKYAAWGGLE